MPLSAGLQATADAKIDNLVSQLTTIQPDYKDTVGAYVPGIAYGHYWQGITCVTPTPADGTTETTDTTVKPTDQDETWADVGTTLDATLPVSLRVDTYDGPQGKGYVVVGTVIEATRTYSRAINVGPETHREQAWTDITPE